MKVKEIMKETEDEETRTEPEEIRPPSEDEIATTDTAVFQPSNKAAADYLIGNIGKLSPSHFHKTS